MSFVSNLFFSANQRVNEHLGIASGNQTALSQVGAKLASLIVCQIVEIFTWEAGVLIVKIGIMNFISY